MVIFENISVFWGVVTFNVSSIPYLAELLKLFLKLTLGLTRPKYQNRVGITKTGDDLGIVFAEIVIKTSVLSVPPDLCRIST